MNDISTQDISVFKGVTLQDDITARAFLLRYPNVETAIARFFDSQEAGPSNPPASLNTSNPPGPSTKPVSFLPVRNSTMNKDSCLTKTDPSSTQPSDKKMAPKERMSEEEDSEEDDFDFEEELDNSPEESSNMFQKFANTMTDAFKAMGNAVKDRINPPVVGPVTEFMEIAGCNEETAKNYINKYGSVGRALDEYFRKEQGEEPAREQQQTPNPFTFNFQAPMFQNQVKEKRRRRSWKKRGADNTWTSNSTGNNNSSKIKFKLRGGYDEYVKKYLKKDLFESSAQEWPKFLGSLLVECKIDNQDTISKMKRHDQIKFQPEEIEFTSTNITKKNKGEDGIPTRTVVGKNWYIKGTSLLVRCIWKDQFVGYLNCELEEAFVFLLTKKYIFVEAVVVDLPEVSKAGEAPMFSVNFNRGFSGYNKIKVQMDVFLTEEVILNPLNVVAIPGRRRGGVKSTRSAKTDEEGESKEEQQAYQMLRLTKESLAKLFNMLKLKVSIPTIVEVRQRIDPFQRIKREKYGVNGRGRRRYYANNFGAQVDVIKNDFSNYYNNKPGNEGNNAKKDNGGMFGGLFKKDLNEEDDDDEEDFDDDFDVDMDSSDGERTGFARFNSYNGFRANSGRFEEEKVNVGNSNKNEGEEANKQNQDLFKNNVSSYYKPADEPETLKSSLHVYQKQALSWMQYREGCIEKEALFEQKLEEQRLLNDLFQEMILLDGSKLYFNPFNGEICAEFPTLKACKGGILADEMGLGKTVMTIALLHAHSRKTGSDKGEFGLSESEEEEEEKEEDSEEEEEEESKKKGRGKRGVQRKSSLKGTLDNFLKKLDKRKKKKKAEDDDEFDLSEEKEEESEEEDEEESKKKGRGKRGVQRRKSLRGKLDDFLNSKKLDSLKKKTEADDDDFDFSEEKEDDDDEEFEISTTKKIKVDNKKSKTVEKKTKADSVAKKKGKSSKPTKKKSASKSREAGTLIVLPMTVLNQWESEIKAHSKPGTLSVFQYYGGGRKKTELENYDVVLTTYGVLESEYSEYLNKVPSGLFDCNWFRVILDEAHYIKSRQTKTTKAACAVKAEYRWCLTGTPLQNKLDDMFSLMQFLRVDTWGEYFWWNTYINKYTSHDEAANLIRGILKPIILRRTKKSTYLNGSNILELPGKKVNTCMVKLTHEERAIYNCFFQGSKQQFNELVTSGTIQYEYAHIFELLIRLRQVCNHPSLVFSKDDLKNKDSLESAVFKFLDKRMPTGGPAKEIKLEPAGNKKTIVVVDDDSEEEKKMETENPMMHSEFIQKTLERLKNKELEPCCICLEEITDPAIAKCGHIFCKTCLTLTVNNLKRCPLCQSVIDLKDIMSISLEDKERCKDLLDMNCATFKKSSKLEAVINESKEVAKRGEKCVVFSQFIGMLNLVERFYKEENIEYRRIDGSCTLKERAKCIEDFNKEKGVTAFLISLKAGAIGLNLTVATNVFLIDPWWNPAVEDQAIERVHRIGQKNNVNVVRFVCEKTIEERIQQLNAQKKDMINKILQFNPQEQKKQNLDNMIYVMRGFDDE